MTGCKEIDACQVNFVDGLVLVATILGPPIIFFCCSNLVLTQATSLDTMGRIAVFACRGALVRYAFLATLVAQECVEWERGYFALFFSRGNGMVNIR
ncbi:hypothetical protein [Burkholderia metallica]|uniref:hypothetical protein n=1 Tax=Burkholderia metallica TaxID=488729 RepID=UPI000D1AB875|nr:hypothetical protein [Burkholderia metallica]